MPALQQWHLRARFTSKGVEMTPHHQPEKGHVEASYPYPHISCTLFDEAVIIVRRKEILISKSRASCMALLIF
jgi:hypothetical protein